MKTISLTLALLSLGIATQSAQAGDFKLSSKSVKQGAAVSAQHYWNNFGCSGGNVMPDLAWQGAPADTKSFAVSFYDKDAPTGSGFWHWVLYDIPAKTTNLAGGENGGVLPTDAVEGNTDLGKPGFFGPCPPVGRKHHYVYTVHALKVDKLPVDKAASPAFVGFVLWQNTIAKTTLQVVAGPRK